MTPAFLEKKTTKKGLAVFLCLWSKPTRNKSKQNPYLQVDGQLATDAKKSQAQLRINGGTGQQKGQGTVACRWWTCNSDKKESGQFAIYESMMDLQLRQNGEKVLRAQLQLSRVGSNWWLICSWENSQPYLRVKGVQLRRTKSQARLWVKGCTCKLGQKNWSKSPVTC